MRCHRKSSITCPDATEYCELHTFDSNILVFFRTGGGGIKNGTHSINLWMNLMFNVFHFFTRATCNFQYRGTEPVSSSRSKWLYSRTVFWLCVLKHPTSQRGWLQRKTDVDTQKMTRFNEHTATWFWFLSENDSVTWVYTKNQMTLCPATRNLSIWKGRFYCSLSVYVIMQFSWTHVVIFPEKEKLEQHIFKSNHCPPHHPISLI